MSEDRERLKAKEELKNPGGTLNNALARAFTGAPGGGCLVNLLSLGLILVLWILFKSCSAF